MAAFSRTANWPTYISAPWGQPTLCSGRSNIRRFYDREGLIVDMRHNFGGNIDSWVLDRLSRKVWTYWQAGRGQPIWNMQEAFRGKLAVLCDGLTASDGEGFTEGFRRLGLGKVTGTRTWGGEIWLSFDNFLADKGIASAAENGVFGPEPKWLIEGHGVDPDVIVDNLPHAAFEGKDAPFDAAISYLQNREESQSRSKASAVSRQITTARTRAGDSHSVNRPALFTM